MKNCSAPFFVFHFAGKVEDPAVTGSNLLKTGTPNQTPACFPASCVENILFVRLTLSFFQTHEF